MRVETYFQSLSDLKGPGRETILTDSARDVLLNRRRDTETKTVRGGCRAILEKWEFHFGFEESCHKFPDEGTDGRADGWTNERVDGWTNERVDEWANGRYEWTGRVEGAGRTTTRRTLDGERVEEVGREER